MEFAALGEAVRESKDAGHLCFGGSAGALVEQGHACLDAIRGEEDVLPLCAHLLKQLKAKVGMLGNFVIGLITVFYWYRHLK